MGTEMDNKIFAAVTAGGLLDIGASKPVSPEPEYEDEVRKLSAAISAPVTYIEIESEAAECDGDDSRAREIVEVLRRMERLIAEGTTVKMRVKAVSDDLTVLEPVEEWMRHDILDYSLKTDFLSKVAGDGFDKDGVFEVRILPFIVPKVRMYILSVAGAEESKIVELTEDSLLNELKAQPDGTFLQVSKGERADNTDENGLTLINVCYSDRIICSSYESSFCNPLPDGTYVLALTRTNRGNLAVDASCGRVLGLPFSPEDWQKYATKEKQNKPLAVGVVHKIFEEGKTLLDVLFEESDGQQWRSGVYRLYTDGTTCLPFPVIEAARQYIRIGFPCEFAIDINSLHPRKSKLYLCGLSAKLQGRVASTVNTRHLVPGIELPVRLLSPAARVGDEIMMVDSQYTAFMPMSEAPKGLRFMAEAGIFSSRLRTPCRLDLIRVDDPAAERNYKLLCSPTAVEKCRVYRKESEVPDVEICCSAQGRLILMAGDIPALTEPLDYDIRMALLRGFTKARWVVDRCRDDGWLVLRYDDLDIVSEDIEAEGITLGEIFEIESDGTCHGRPVITVPQGNTPAGGDLMMALIVEEKTGAIVATDEFSHFTDLEWTGVRRMKVRPELLDYNVLVVESPDGKLNACRLRNDAERLILQRLKSLYGAKTTALMTRSPQSKLITCDWTGVACQHDYTALLGTTVAADVAELWDGLDEDTPVLFGDIALSRRELPNLPAASPATVVRDDAAPVSRRDKTGGQLWEVMRFDKREDTLSFWTGKKEVGHVGRNALRLPEATTVFQRMAQKALDDILKPASKWRIERDDAGKVRIHAHTDSTLRYYTLVSRLNDSEWVVRSDDGSIAVGRSIEGPAEAGRRIMMAYNGEIGPVVYVAPKDEILIGRKLRLQVMEVTGEVAVCSDMTGRILKRIELPLMHVSWNGDWSPEMLLPGTVLKAVVVDEEPGRLVVDRRLPLHQDALYPGVRPEPGAVYQMEVAGVANDGYRLCQNGVELLLPFENAAVFDINIFNEGYLRLGDLIAVRAGVDGVTADWRPTKAKAIAELENAGDSLLTFYVHHYSPDGLFVMYRGVMMFLPNQQVGHWAGRTLEEYFPVGTLLPLLVEQTDKGMLEAKCLNPLPFTQPAPDVGCLLNGTVSYVYPDMGCYVDCGGDVPPVYVEAAKFEKAGVEMLPGVSLEVMVTAVLEDAGVVMGCIGTAAASQDSVIAGESEPAMENECSGSAGPDDSRRDMPELKFFSSFAVPPAENATVVELCDPDGNYAIFYPTAEMPVKKLIGYVQCGPCIMMVSCRLDDGPMIVEYDPLIGPWNRLRTMLAENTKVRLSGRVIGYTGKKGVLLQSGYNSLVIPRKSLKVKPDMPEYAVRYALGAEIEVMVYSTCGGVSFSATDVLDEDNVLIV